MAQRPFPSRGFRRTGEGCGKIAYPNRTSARVAMKRLVASPGYYPFENKRLNIYRCDRCNGEFHVGHTFTN